MQAERDHLVRFVFPRLREDLIKHKIHLVDVDLRWGVTSDQDAYEVCMEEIDNCHPRFICILGGRYGWIPPETNISITASEIHYGALDKLNEPVFRYFYFRDPKVTNSIPDEFAEEYQEPKGSEKEYSLESLKEKIMDPQTKGKVLIKPGEVECRSLPYYIYPCKWDEKLKRTVDLESFGTHVYTDLIHSIYTEFGKGEAEILNEFEEEKTATDSFINQKIQNYVIGSRRELLNSIKNFFEDNDRAYLCLYGEPGSGKTALMAKFYQEYNNDHPNQLMIPIFIGSTIKSTDPRQILRRLYHELSKITDYNEKPPEEYEKLKESFNSLLIQASKVKPIIILIDAINQINQTDISWLPNILPKNVYILISTISGPVLDLLRNRRIPPEEKCVFPLESSDTEMIIDEFLNRYRKKFDKKQKTALMDKTDSNNPLYLSTALEELRTLGTYEEITDRILELPGTVQPLFQWILKRLENDEGFIGQNGNLIGSKLVPEFTSLISVSRHGLSQKELTDLIDPDDPHGNVAALQRLIRPYLMYKDNLIYFYHSQLLDAVYNEYLTDENVKTNFHLKLADYFESQEPCERKVEELPWQLDHAESWHRLKDCITELIMSMKLMTEPKKYELMNYWHHIEDQYDMANEYKKAIQRYKNKLNDEALSGYYSAIAKFLQLNAYYNDAELVYRYALHIRERFYGSENTDMAEGLNNLATLLQSKGDYENAELFYRRALKINEKFLGRSHRDTALNLNNLAFLLYNKGDLSSAEPLYREALKINENVLGLEHPQTAQCLNNLALLLHAKGNYDVAESFYKHALDINEKVLGPEHPETANNLNNLASLFKSKGDCNKAEILHKQALEIREKVLGPESPYTAESLNNLGILFYQNKDYDNAEPLLLRALKIRRNVLGPEHPHTAQSLNNLAMLLQDKGNYGSAEILHRQALEIRKKVFGALHPDIAESLSNLASLFFYKKEYNNAEPLYRRALEISEKVLGPEHPDIALRLNNLAFLLHNNGDYDGAEPLYIRSLGISEKFLGLNHPQCSTIRHNLNILFKMRESSYKDNKFKKPRWDIFK